MTKKTTRSSRAFVLCGGLGTRLRSVLNNRPKSMASVGGVPFLHLLLGQLRAQGITEVVLGTGYLAEQIEEYFDDGSDFGLSISYSREPEPLGTGGALKLAEPLLSDPAIVINGDSYIEWNLAAVNKLFADKDADVVMVLQAVPDASRYGSVKIETDGRVVEFVEKGTRKGGGLINAGIYLLQKGIIADLPSQQAVSLEREVFPRLLGEKFYGLVSGGLFIDIGIPSELERAQRLLEPQAALLRRS